MKKSSVLALVSLFFVASVASFPLNEPVTSSLTTDSELHQDLVDSEDFEDDFSDDFEDGSLSDDLGTENNERIKKFVLGQPMPKQVTTGNCYQQCKSETRSECINAKTNKDVRKYTMGTMNYCIAQCGVVNTNCFKRS